MKFDFWGEVRKVHEAVICYPWSTYGVQASEAYEQWRTCLQEARRKQLQELDTEPLLRGKSIEQTPTMC